MNISHTVALDPTKQMKLKDPRISRMSISDMIIVPYSPLNDTSGAPQLISSPVRHVIITGCCKLNTTMMGGLQWHR
jgi:hypothetical protein